MVEIPLENFDLKEHVLQYYDPTSYNDNPIMKNIIEKTNY